MSDLIRVLLVEDEPVLAAIIKESLEKRGLMIIIACNGVEAWSLFKSVKPDICVIDIMLPRKDGFVLVSEIRLVDKEVPVIFLTARTQTDDVIRGLEIGADDYMKKPFSMEELILRIRALIRRSSGINDNPADNEVDIGRFRFRHRLLELADGTEVIKLSQREGDLLLLLVKNKNQLLDRKAALLKLWGDDSPFNARSMDVYITRLRKYLRQDDSLEITNSRGLGYTLFDYSGGRH